MNMKHLSGSNHVHFFLIPLSIGACIIAFIFLDLFRFHRAYTTLHTIVINYKYPLIELFSKSFNDFQDCMGYVWTPPPEDTGGKLAPSCQFRIETELNRVVSKDLSQQYPSIMFVRWNKINGIEEAQLPHSYAIRQLTKNDTEYVKILDGNMPNFFIDLTNFFSYLYGIYGFDRSSKILIPFDNENIRMGLLTISVSDLK